MQLGAAGGASGRLDFSQNSAAHEGCSFAVFKCNRISIPDELFHLGWRDDGLPVDFQQALISRRKQGRQQSRMSAMSGKRTSRPTLRRPAFGLTGVHDGCRRDCIRRR